MQIFNWENLDSFKNSDFFSNGTGISTGCFDGIHLGHKVLLEKLIQGCKKDNLSSGIVTFTRPLPSLKTNGEYKGDVSTLSQRLSIFEEMGIDFVILVDFNDSFARNSGEQFLSILIEKCKMKYIVEGVDFRCGYKGATDKTVISDFAETRGISVDFVEPVIFTDETNVEHRISSSYIRDLVSVGSFNLVEKLLNRKYSLDLKKIACQIDRTYYIYSRKDIIQVLPKSGKYSVLCNKKQSIADFEEEKMLLENKTESVLFL